MDIVERARALLAAATPGPWTAYRCDGVDEIGEPGQSSCGIRSPAWTDQWGADIVSDTNRDECCHMMTLADAELIAAAPTLIAELVEEVERLRANKNDLKRGLRLRAQHAMTCKAEDGEGCTCEIETLLEL
jgi:hypothetical protein